MCKDNEEINDDIPEEVPDEVEAPDLISVTESYDKNNEYKEKSD